MLSKNFDDSVTIMARIRLARIALTKMQKAIFGTRRVALESKKIAYEALVPSLLLYGSECWVVSAENMRLPQRVHRKCIRIMCRVTRHHTRKHHIQCGKHRFQRISAAPRRTAGAAEARRAEKILEAVVASRLAQRSVLGTIRSGRMYSPAQ
jgi:hypothetical protein